MNPRGKITLENHYVLYLSHFRYIDSQFILRIHSRNIHGDEKVLSVLIQCELSLAHEESNTYW